MSLDIREAATAAPPERAPRAPETPPQPEPEADTEMAWDDPRSPHWEGIPRQVIERVGVYDKDSAGGCG
jgi:hypothetical protein